MDELFRSDNVVVRRMPAIDTNRWVITFDHYGLGPGFDRPGFGEAYLQAHGISAIHVMGKAEDWYQYEEMPTVLETIRRAAQGADRVMTYGSSMGGYAALRFADAVGASDALALSPQYSIDPAIAPHEDRWSQDSRRIRWLPEIDGSLACSAEAVMVFDPIGPDRWHGDRIAQDIRITSVRLPYTGHPVTTFLSETGLLNSLVQGILGGTFDTSAFRRAARDARPESAVYLSHLAAALARRRTDTAFDVAHRGLQVSPGNTLARLSLARLLTRQGRHDESLKILSELVEESDRSLVYTIAYGDALVQAGRSEEARAIADEVLSQSTDVAHLHAWAAFICWQNRDVDDARRNIRAALIMEPGNRNYLRHALNYHLGRTAPKGGTGVRTTFSLRMARKLSSLYFGKRG